MNQEDTIDTILDRPLGLRLIGITQMTFGFLGILGAIGLLVATLTGHPTLSEFGVIYTGLIIIGVIIPGLVIGNYVDDLRRNAVIAQIIYSIAAAGICSLFLYVFGIGYNWTVPWFEIEFVVYIGNLATFILGVESIFALYLVVKWNDVAPPPGVHIVRDRKKAEKIEAGLIPSPLEPSLLSPDGTPLSHEESERILEVRKIETTEGMAILCSNCGGANPLSEVEDNNTLVCEYCGVRMAVSSVFVPCENHPEYLAATKCAVCGDHFCRQCLTAQEPPVDERWTGSLVFLCQRCFEGRYRPAVTTTSLVVPIGELFTQAGGRFSKVGAVYRRFLGAYTGAMKYVGRFTLELAANLGKAGGKSGGGDGDGAAAMLIMIIVAIVAIPILAGIVLLAGAIVIIPVLFYAGLIGVTIEAIKIIRRTDFVSLEHQRDLVLKKGKQVEKKESPLREESRPWQSPRYKAQSSRQAADSFWRKV